MVQTTIFVREVQSVNGMLEQLSATQDAIAKQQDELENAQICSKNFLGGNCEAGRIVL